MKISIISMKPRSKPAVRLWAVVLWLALWQLAAVLVGRDFLLASPVTTALRFIELAFTGQFWISALRSLCRILSGFLLGAGFGAALAGLSARFVRLRELIAPLYVVLRAIPVASFVVVALLWVPSGFLSVFISFLIVFPLIYSETLSAIDQTDARMLEMARLFHMSAGKRALYVYALPALHRLEAACSAAIGLAWKSGVAAELISIPSGTIGEKLYSAKVYLMTGDLFAWTLLIVLLSAACARIFSLLLHKTAAWLERM